MIRPSVLVGLVVVALAAAACGSDQDPTIAGSVPSSSSSSSSSSTTIASSATVGEPDPAGCSGAEAGTPAELTLDVTHDPLVAGAPVTWMLAVTNDGDTEVELVFGSGQDGDAALTGPAGEIYRWSDGMSFTQILRCQALPPGATAGYELAEPALDVEPGSYQLRVSLAAEPAPRDLATAVTVAAG